MDENIHQICFNVLFELSEAYTTRIPQKTVQKPLKTTENAVAGTNILPQNPKSADIFPLPPPLWKCRKYTGVHAWVYQQLILSQCL